MDTSWTDIASQLINQAGSAYNTTVLTNATGQPYYVPPSNPGYIPSVPGKSSWLVIAALILVAFFAWKKL